MDWAIAIFTIPFACQIIWFASKGYYIWAFYTQPAFRHTIGPFPLKWFMTGLVVTGVSVVIFYGWWALWGSAAFEDGLTKTVPKEMVCVLPETGKEQ